MLQVLVYASVSGCVFLALLFWRGPALCRHCDWVLGNIVKVKSVHLDSSGDHGGDSSLLACAGRLVSMALNILNPPFPVFTPHSYTGWADVMLFLISNKMHIVPCAVYRHALMSKTDKVIIYCETVLSPVMKLSLLTALSHYVHIFCCTSHGSTGYNKLP